MSFALLCVSGITHLIPVLVVVTAQAPPKDIRS
jgi:hypothetical protein